MVPLKRLHGDLLLAQGSAIKKEFEYEQHGYGRSSQETDVDSSHLSDGSEPESESEAEDFELYSGSPDEYPILDHNHPLAKFADELKNLGLWHFSKLMGGFDPKGKASETTEDPAEPARKRIKAECFEEYTEVECSTDSEDTDTVIVEATKPREYLFACPFQRRKPDKYRSCLREGGFLSIRKLTGHLLAVHRLPYYCPVCGQIFNSSGACDDHIREKACDLKPETEAEGLSDSQIKKISQRLSRFESKEEQWYEIWKVAFPGVAKPLVPCASSHSEWLIYLLREYWSKDGQDIVSSFLKSKQLKEDPIAWDEQDVLALNRMVLNRMVGAYLESWI
ncbi:hypothetical protein QQZ08_002495 [Neonectria magnoliae]|uniref:C2H2-type domain-containing protein n=1 Tax=Neonectria magnoliae TaxID=2732573 RepID=A0ABR1IDS4_9HYPO